MALPYPTKVVLPFDIATAQDMNERHANDVALAAGTGLNDGAITADKIDFTTLAFGNYSTNEVDTGFKWIDGKTIYKKTISFGALPNNTAKNVAHGITGLSWLISVESMTRTSAGLFIELNRTASTFIVYNVDSTNISVTSNSDMSGYTTTYLTMLYTKS